MQADTIPGRAGKDLLTVSSEPGATGRGYCRGGLALHVSPLNRIKGSGFVTLFDRKILHTKGWRAGRMGGEKLGAHPLIL